MKQIYKYRDYLYLHLIYLFFSAISFLSKFISGTPVNGWSFWGLYLLLLISMGIYAFFWQKIIKVFPIVVAYSHKGVVIFWVMLWSVLFFNEKILWNNVLGAMVIFAGIWMVSHEQ